MSQVLSLFLRLNCVAVLTVCSITATFSQTTTPQAATTTPASKTVQPTGPGGRPLTPAEIRLREKQAKWIEDHKSLPPTHIWVKGGLVFDPGMC